ncbi:hypothetical protein JEQ12_014899 [Ovis aries]|uniref:LIM domain only protein 3 n=1 Tax=Ovis aries TaxID=9940 RepID=A0A836ABE3_SHEEP|nr:hypothetical protein JEQ12_014899 [Ovis aries]
MRSCGNSGTPQSTHAEKGEKFCVIKKEKDSEDNKGIQMLSVQPDTKPKGCAGCNRKIKDRYLLKALDKYWHEDCLKCACCDCRLGEVGSTLYTKANLILCRRDYLRLFGVTGNCAACSKLIPAFEMVMRAKDNVYHLDCFACQLCNQRFCVGDKFFLKNNMILCQTDYEEGLMKEGYAPQILPKCDFNARQANSKQTLTRENKKGILFDDALDVRNMILWACKGKIKQDDWKTKGEAAANSWMSILPLHFSPNNNNDADFPGCPVVKNSPCNAEDTGTDSSRTSTNTKIQEPLLLFFHPDIFQSYYHVTVKISRTETTNLQRVDGDVFTQEPILSLEFQKKQKCVGEREEVAWYTAENMNLGTGSKVP